MFEYLNRRFFVAIKFLNFESLGSRKLKKMSDPRTGIPCQKVYKSQCESWFTSGITLIPPAVFQVFTLKIHSALGPRPCRYQLVFLIVRSNILWYASGTIGFFALGEVVVRDLPFNMSHVTYLSLGFFQISSAFLKLTS